MAPKQEDLPGTESPDRNPELHALGLELHDLQSQRMELTKREKAKRQEISTVLDRLKMDDYDCDGLHLWLEETEKVRVKVGGGGE